MAQQAVEDQDNATGALTKSRVFMEAQGRILLLFRLRHHPFRSHTNTTVHQLDSHSQLAVKISRMSHSLTKTATFRRWHSRCRDLPFPDQLIGLMPFFQVKWVLICNVQRLWGPLGRQQPPEQPFRHRREGEMHQASCGEAVSTQDRQL